MHRVWLITAFIICVVNVHTNQDYMAAQRFWRRTFDQAVAGSIPSRGVMKAPRSTQPSIPPG